MEVRPFERTVLVDGAPVSLTPGEYELVEMMAEHPGWVFSADQLSRDAESDHSPDSVSVLVSRLRHKLSSVGVHDAIETVRGFGYRLRPEAPPASQEVESAGSRELRDAAWLLAEAVFEVERSGSPEQRQAAASVLEQTRRDLYGRLSQD